LENIKSLYKDLYKIYGDVGKWWPGTSENGGQEPLKKSLYQQFLLKTPIGKM